QLVSSLAEVATGRIKLKADGQALVPGHLEWRTSELPPDFDPPQARADLTGLMVADGRVRTLRDGEPILGPAGSGGYQIRSAARSLDGGQLAVVERSSTGMRLRVGPFGQALSEVQLPARTPTRPTWRPVKAPAGEG